MIFLPVDALRQVLNGTKKSRAEMSEGADMILEGLQKKQATFEKDKERISNDIKRGTRLSRGKLPG